MFALLFEVVRNTLPLNALLCVNAMAFAPLLKLEVPDTLKAPDCVKDPEVTFKLPDVEAAPKFNALEPDEMVELVLLPIATAFEELEFKIEMVFANEFDELLKVIALPFALRLEVPETDMVPACVIAPDEAAVKLPPMELVPNCNAPLFDTFTSPEIVDTFIAEVILFEAFVMVIVPVPVLTLTPEPVTGPPMLILPLPEIARELPAPKL